MKNLYTEIFTEKTRDELIGVAEGGCECEYFNDAGDWLEMPEEYERCRPCMANAAVIAADRVVQLEHQYDAVRARQSQIIAQVQGLAEANCNTKIIGGAHATLKAIIEIIGVEE